MPHPIATAGAALLLLLGAAPSARAEAAPLHASSANSPGQPTPARSADPSGETVEPAAGDYAAREAKDPELAKFAGGEHEHIYIGSSVVVVLLVVLLIVLVVH